MELDDFLEPEIAVTAAVAAAIFSPRARKVLRQGAVYGLAGVMIAGDTLANFTRGVSRSVRQTGASATQAVQNTTGQRKTGKSASETATADTPSPQPTASAEG